MLPNRFSLDRQTEEKLKREKQRTGISPNVMARELFFISIESQKKFEDADHIEPGSMTLDKAVWLGECQTAIERILENMYPGKTPEVYAKLWALHISSSFSSALQAKAHHRQSP